MQSFNSNQNYTNANPYNSKGGLNHASFAQSTNTVQTNFSRSNLPNQRKQQGKSWFTNSKVIAAIVVSITLVIGAAFSFLVPVYGQTLASRTMDALGWHSAAMKIDAIHQKDKAMVVLASIDVSKPEQCGQMWPYLDSFKPSRLEAMQFKNLISIRPVNQKYAQDFFLETYIDARMSLVQQKAWAEIEFSGRLNGSKLSTLIQEIDPQFSSQELEGNFAVLASGQAYLDSNLGAFRVPQIKVEGGRFLNTQDSLDRWYKKDFNLTSVQKQGLNELLSLFMDLSEVKITDMITEETGKTILKNYCKLIDKIEVKGPQKAKVGRSSNEVVVRPIFYNLVQNSAQIEQQIAPEIVKSVADDSRLPEYLKSKYLEVVRFIRALNKINRDVSGLREITQREYEQAIDESFKILREILRESVNQNTVELDNSYESELEIVNLPVEVLVDIQTGFVVATKSTTIIKPRSNILAEMPSGSLRDLFQEGIKITQEIYDIAYNDQVGQIPNISGTVRPIEDMANDFMATNLYSKLEFWFEGLVKNDSLLPGASMDDPNFPNLILEDPNLILEDLF
jgi:hypothetical protein